MPRSAAIDRCHSESHSRSHSQCGTLRKCRGILQVSLYVFSDNLCVLHAQHSSKISILPTIGGLLFGVIVNCAMYVCVKSQGTHIQIWRVIPCVRRGQKQLSRQFWTKIAVREDDVKRFVKKAGRTAFSGERSHKDIVVPMSNGLV